MALGAETWTATRVSDPADRRTLAVQRETKIALMALWEPLWRAAGPCEDVGALLHYRGLLGTVPRAATGSLEACVARAMALALETGDEPA